MTEALSDRELNEAIAAAIGLNWREHIVPEPPPYSTSIDALEPVEARLREAGPWAVDVSVLPSGVTSVEWGEAGSPFMFASATAPTESRARAEAALQALQAIAKVEAGERT